MTAMTKRPRLSKIAASLDTLIAIDAPGACHRAKSLRRSESDELLSDLRHARDFIAKAATRPQEALWLMEGVDVAPFTAIHSAARQIAEEGAE